MKIHRAILELTTIVRRRSYLTSKASRQRKGGLRAALRQSRHVFPERLVSEAKTRGTGADDIDSTGGLHRFNHPPSLSSFLPILPNALPSHLDDNSPYYESCRDVSHLGISRQRDYRQQITHKSRYHYQDRCNGGECPQRLWKSAFYKQKTFLSTSCYYKIIGTHQYNKTLRQYFIVTLYITLSALKYSFPRER